MAARATHGTAPTGVVLALLAGALVAAAGCLDPEVAPSPPPIAIGHLEPERMRDGGFYQFHHAGGELALWSNFQGGDGAAFDLYGPDHRRIAVPVVPAPDGRDAGVAAIDAEAGRYVLSLYGWEELEILALKSGGIEVESVRPLARHVERHVLASTDKDAPLAQVPVPLQPQPIDEAFTLRLARTPVHLSLTVAGSITDLHFDAASPLGPVLATADAGAGAVPFNGLQARDLYPIVASFHPENVVDEFLELRIKAEDLVGELILESISYSLAGAPEAKAGRADDLTFLYGRLPPGEPNAFQVPPGARVLGFSDLAVPTFGEDFPHDGDDAPAPSVVLLYGPDGSTQVVRFRSDPVFVAAEPGPHVAVLLTGAAFVFVDATPIDFQLHAMTNRTVLLPQEPGGADGHFGIESTTFDPDDEVVFAARPLAMASSSGPLPAFFIGSAGGCDHSWINLRQEGESVAYASIDDLQAGTAAGFDGVGTRLAPGPLEILHGGFGDASCYVGAQLRLFTRPER
ncbi:MAG: hypothetical protein ACPGQL_04375 [Thermoplasmatota archaeon]